MNTLKSLFVVLALTASTAVLANPQKNAPKKPAKPAKEMAKIVDVWTCPIMGSDMKPSSKPDKDAVVVAKKYRVHFCCAGCPEEFAKLSDKDKLAKAEMYAKKQAAKKAPKKG